MQYSDRFCALEQRSGRFCFTTLFYFCFVLCHIRSLKDGEGDCNTLVVSVRWITVWVGFVSLLYFILFLFCFVSYKKSQKLGGDCKTGCFCALEQRSGSFCFTTLFYFIFVLLCVIIFVRSLRDWEGIAILVISVRWNGVRVGFASLLYFILFLVLFCVI